MKKKNVFLLTNYFIKFKSYFESLYSIYIEKYIEVLKLIQIETVYLIQNSNKTNNH